MALTQEEIQRRFQQAGDYVGKQEHMANPFGISPQTSTPRTSRQSVTSPGLRNLMDAQRTAGGSAVPVARERFQNTQQIGQLIDQMQRQLQPFVDARLAASEAEFNRAQQQLRNRLASQGALAGGGATAQQLAALQDFARYQDQIRGEQLAQAVPWAFQAGELGLREADMLFNQNMANRQFDLARAQQAVQNMLSALGFEEGVRQFDQTFDEGQRRFNIDAATQLSQIFGVPIQPKSSGRELFNQVMGIMPVNARVGLAGMLGVDPITGQPTFAAQESAANRALSYARMNSGGGSPMRSTMDLLQEQAAQRIMSGMGTEADFRIIGRTPPDNLRGGGTAQTTIPQSTVDMAIRQATATFGNALRQSNSSAFPQESIATLRDDIFRLVEGLSNGDMTIRDFESLLRRNIANRNISAAYGAALAQAAHALTR